MPSLMPARSSSTAPAASRGLRNLSTGCDRAHCDRSGGPRQDSPRSACPSTYRRRQFSAARGSKPQYRVQGLGCYQDIETLLSEVPAITAVALCTTPQVRYQAARYALERGRHVLLEKPPGANVCE